MRMKVILAWGLTGLVGLGLLAVTTSDRPRHADGTAGFQNNYLAFEPKGPRRTAEVAHRGGARGLAAAIRLCHAHTDARPRLHQRQRVG